MGRARMYTSMHLVDYNIIMYLDGRTTFLASEHFAPIHAPVDRLYMI